MELHEGRAYNIYQESLRITKPILFRNCTFTIWPNASIEIDLDRSKYRPSSSSAVIFDNCKFSIASTNMQNTIDALIRTSWPIEFRDCSFKSENSFATVKYLIQLDNNGGSPFYRRPIRLKLERCSFSNLKSAALIKFDRPIILSVNNCEVTNSVFYRSLVFNEARNILESTLEGEIDNLTIEYSRFLTENSIHTIMHTDFLVSSEYNSEFIRYLQVTNLKVRASYINSLTLHYKASYNSMQIESSYLEDVRLPFTVTNRVFFNNCSICNLETPLSLSRELINNEPTLYNVYYQLASCYIANLIVG